MTTKTPKTCGICKKLPLVEVVIKKNDFTVVLCEVCDSPLMELIKENNG